MNDKRLKAKNIVLKWIIDEYIQEPKPVGSVYLISKYEPGFSSATVRNIMVELEKEGFIEKSHTSSGRVPTSKGYKYYAQFLTNTIDEKLKLKIRDIFQKRNQSIDNTIDEVVALISEITNLTVVTSAKIEDEYLKSINITPIDGDCAIIVIITSNGNIDSKKIQLDSKINMNDMKIAIRIFQERLNQTRLSDIKEKLVSITPILREKIKCYEEIIETFVDHVFTNYLRVAKNKVFGKSYIIQSEDIERNELAHVISLIENQSIWESIDDKYFLEENLKLEILPNNTSFVSKRLNINGNIKEVSFVGPARTNYSAAKNILNIIEKYAQSSLLEKKEEEEI